MKKLTGEDLTRARFEGYQSGKEVGKQETLKQVNEIISRFKCKGEITLDGCFIWNVSEVDEFDKEMEKLK